MFDIYSPARADGVLGADCGTLLPIEVSVVSWLCSPNAAQGVDVHRDVEMSNKANFK